jgi:hypothetical protein
MHMHTHASARFLTSALPCTHRLQQYGKQPQHGSLSRTASASDDLQLQSSLRDQLAWQNSHHHHHQQQTVQVHHVMHQHAPAAHHSGVLGVAAAIAAAGAGLAAAGGGGAAAHMRPTTLARAVAAINSGKDWKERADAMDALAALLAKQVCVCVCVCVSPQLPAAGKTL